MIINKVIKTGMKNEYENAISHASRETLVLTGQQLVPDLEKHVPSTAKMVLSYGMFGGLNPTVWVGMSCICDYLVDGDGNRYQPTARLKNYLHEKTGFPLKSWFSNGHYNTANTPQQKEEFFRLYKVDCIDDETLYVAQYAIKHGLEWGCIRNCSDAAEDNVEITRNLLDASGNVQAWNVIKDFATDPKDMIKIWENYNKSNAGLGTLGVKLGAIHWGFE